MRLEGYLVIGTRTQQLGLFDVGNVYSLDLGESSFYHQLAVAGPRLFRDEDFAEFYATVPSRPSVPPSQLALMTLLHQYTGCSDQEAVERSAYDLRWCAVLGKAAGEPLCAKSTFQLFRAHLVVHEKMGAILVKSIEEAKRSGLLKRGSALKVHLDTKPIIGRGSVEDTYNLLGRGIRGLVEALARLVRCEPREWAAAHDLGRYFTSSLKGSAGIDWSEAGERQALLTEIVVDARRVLRLAGQALAAVGAEERGRTRVREAAQLLTRVLLQDIEQVEDGEGGIQASLKEGTAPERMPSLTDPEQRHGRKSKSKRFTGHKAAVVVDAESQIITDVAVLPGNASDAEGALGQVERSEENTGERVAESTGDCAYGNPETRDAFAAAGRDFAAKVPQESGNGGRYPKSMFRLDLEGNTVTCPAGHTIGRFEHEKGGGKVFRFGALCQGCPLRDACTTAAEGRTIHVHRQEAGRAQARAYQKTPEGKARLCSRVVVEHALARLAGLGIGQARYLGRAKTLFQLTMAATVANLRRVWNWEANGAQGGCEGAPGHSRQGRDAGAATILRAVWGRLRLHIVRWMRPAEAGLAQSFGF